MLFLKIALIQGSSEVIPRREPVKFRTHSTRWFTDSA